MGSSIFHKILRTQSNSTTARIIPLINKSFLSPPPLPPLRSAAGECSSSAIHHLPVSQTTGVQIPLLAVPENGDRISIRSHRSEYYYPCFSVGIFLNSNPSLVKTDIDGAVPGDTPMIWADSVKKKRKKKMNKHKLRKLRKRNSKKS